MAKRVSELAKLQVATLLGKGTGEDTETEHEALIAGASTSASPLACDNVVSQDHRLRFPLLCGRLSRQ